MYNKLFAIIIVSILVSFLNASFIIQKELSETKTSLCSDCRSYCPYKTKFCCADTITTQWTCYDLSQTTNNVPITCRYK